ncbi:MAG: hypothetical protein ABIP55_03695 [Tepidisphaeraceae bacterium]
MRRSMFVSAVLATGLSAAPIASGAVEDFHLLSQSVAVDAAARIATFTLTFDRPPEFDAPGEQTHAFQYEIDADSSALDQPIQFGEIDSVIRGAEIHGGSEIPLRAPEGDGGPDAGGWGPVTAMLPFDLAEQTVTFTTGLATIGDDDGKFRYRLITIENGSLTSEIQGAVVPLPAAAWTGIAMMSGLGAAGTLRRLIRKE